MKFNLVALTVAVFLCHQACAITERQLQNQDESSQQTEDPQPMMAEVPVMDAPKMVSPSTAEKVNDLVDLAVEVEQPDISEHIPEDDHLTDNEKTMVFSLLEALDAMAEHADVEDQDKPTADALKGLQADANQRLLNAGYVYRTMGNKRVLSRIANNNNNNNGNPGMPNGRTQNTTELVRGMFDIVQTAARLGPLFSTTTSFGRYGRLLATAAHIVEGMLAPRQPAATRVFPHLPRLGHH
ncbi:uncharacterized protein BX664DRAFT_352704 [Halteromyces radiatus]|uniref:uncharacterized protein n=1 Tax=Halteromyces radiatus TaxID=101107 RepID=UPI0022201077|nr:uncharacterized protein BX664DRAFT_352704 [Halteromyces radiatus]KAI8081571.1 hypothetical protein BX664DRAFT_352704 [Halteromyces radiatus]